MTYWMPPAPRRRRFDRWRRWYRYARYRLLLRLAGPRPRANLAYIAMLERAIWEARAVTDEKLELEVRGRIVDGISLFDDYRIRRTTEDLARLTGLTIDQAAEFARDWSDAPAPEPAPADTHLGRMQELTRDP